jgi:hypothetical protein
MKKMLLVLLVSVFAQAKDVIRVDVTAVHSVTHNGRSLQDFMLSGPYHPVRQVESYNITLTRLLMVSMSFWLAMI